MIKSKIKSSISLHLSAFLYSSLHFIFYISGQFGGAYCRPMDAIYSVLAQVIHFFSKMLTVVFVQAVLFFLCFCLEDQRIHFWNWLWRGLLPVESIVVDNPLIERILPLCCRWSGNPGVQTVVLNIHQLHGIQSWPHNSSGECLSCTIGLSGISPIDCWDDVTLSELGHKINTVALK